MRPHHLLFVGRTNLSWHPTPTIGSSAKHIAGGLKRALLRTLLAGVTSWFCTVAFAQDLVTEAWATLDERRTPEIRLDQFGYGETILPLKGLKLTDDSMVLTFEGSLATKKQLFLLIEFCDAEDGVWLSDATLLRPDEAPEEFVEANLRFFLPSSDALRFCIPVGMQMTSEGLTQVFTSEDRVIAHLNRWAWFLGRYRSDAERAGEFLNLSLTMQIDALHAVIGSREAENLQLQMSYFDSTEPLALLNAGVTRPHVDANILRRYLEVTTRARGKLLAFYPEHRDRLERERTILQELAEVTADD